MSDTEQPGTALVPVTEPAEPTLDTGSIHLVAGSIKDVLDHMKAWVEWRLTQAPAIPPSDPPTSLSA